MSAFRRNSNTPVTIASISGSSGTLTSNGGDMIISGTTITTTDKFTRIEVYNCGTISGNIVVGKFTFPVPCSCNFDIDVSPTNAATFSITGDFHAVLLG